MSKRFFVILILGLLLFSGYYVFSQKKADAPKGGVALTNHVSGAGKKNVTLVEYGDFECPACGSYYPLVKQIKEKFADDITFQFRNFPLIQIHQHAFEAHRAAEAASLQGKFWEMYDLLYSRQQTWVRSANPSSDFESYANELGLDIAKFKTDFASSAVNDTINADVAEGQKLKLTGTPSFFLDGKQIESLTVIDTVDKFTKLIQDEIDAKNPGSAKTTTPTTTPTTDNSQKATDQPSTTPTSGQ
jgi:protein-disulfide isomerase